MTTPRATAISPPTAADAPISEQLTTTAAGKLFIALAVFVGRVMNDSRDN
jgi:hypothetical protein